MQRGLLEEAMDAAQTHAHENVQTDQQTQRSDPSRPITDWEETFRLMTYRRLQRQLKGVYAKENQCRTIMWVVMFLGLEVGLATVTLNEGVQLQINLTLKLLKNLLGALVLVVCLYCVLRVRFDQCAQSPPTCTCAD